MPAPRVAFLEALIDVRNREVRPLRLRVPAPMVPAKRCECDRWGDGSQLGPSHLRDSLNLSGA